MKHSSLTVFVVRMIVGCSIGLSTIPFWAIVVQYINSMVSINGNRGYLTYSSDYIFRAPLVYIVIVLCIHIVWGVTYLIYHQVKNKK